MSTHQSGQQTSTGTVLVDSVPAPNEGAPIGFFAIGLVINLVLLGAYLVWAWRQWKKTGAGDSD